MAAPIPDTPDLAVRDSGICAGSTVDTDEAIEPPVSASEMTRTGCALTNVLNAYFGAWAGHDVTAITSYFNNGVVIVVEGEAPFVAPGTYEAVAAVEILETFFNNGLCIKRPHRGGGSGRTHNETLFLTFDTGDTFQTQHRLRFTTDPFAAARDDEQPLVTHTISF